MLVKQRFFIIILSLFLIVNFDAKAQFSSIKVDGLGLLSTNINVAIDIKLDKTHTLNLPFSCNPFTFNDLTFNHYTVHPGIRFWKYENYIGHFFSIYSTYSYFNLYNKGSIYSGFLVGLGGSYGYSFLLSTRLSLELEVGASVCYTNYDNYLQYVGIFEDEIIEHHSRVLLLPTKLSVNISYLF